MAGDDRLVHHRHPDQIRAEEAYRADLCRCLEARAAEARVDTLTERDALLVSRFGEHGAQARVVGVDHVDEPSARAGATGGRSHEGVGAAQVEVVANPHEASRTDAGVGAAGRVGQDEDLAAGRGERAHRHVHAERTAALVVVGTALEDHDGDVSDAADGHTSVVAGDAGAWKPGQVGVGQAGCRGDDVGHGAEARAEDQPDPRAAPARGHDRRRRMRGSVGVDSRLRRLAHALSMPAPGNAGKPSSARLVVMRRAISVEIGRDAPDPGTRRRECVPAIGGAAPGARESLSRGSS
jgi:hypothetical protein